MCGRLGWGLPRAFDFFFVSVNFASPLLATPRSNQCPPHSDFQSTLKLAPSDASADGTAVSSLPRLPFLVEIDLCTAEPKSMIGPEVEASTAESVPPLTPVYNSPKGSMPKSESSFPSISSIHSAEFLGGTPLPSAPLNSTSLLKYCPVVSLVIETVYSLPPS